MAYPEGKFREIKSDEIIVDNFAGGGGASTGIEMALGRPVDIAINHDPVAIAMHRVNYPHTKHFCESVWDVDPVKACAGRPVGLAWFSPDCKHFSKAKGGKPVEKKIRGLAWVVIRWAATVKPRIIALENVEEFVTWGPLVKGPDGKMKPDPKRKGREFNAFLNALRRQGYAVEYRQLRACDYGAPTIRKRLFIIARCDGRPIVWPEPTHGDPKSEAVKSGRLKPWRTAAECIDWSIPAPSIFERKKPLAEATQRRIAKGIMRYVVNNAKPFIVTYYGPKGPDDFRGQSLDEPLRTQTTENRHGLVVPYITEHANASSPRSMPVDEPLRTQCAQTKGGHFALVAPHMVRTDMHQSNSGCTYDVKDQLRTITSGGGHALVFSFLAKHYGGVVGSDLEKPIGTVTSVDHHSLVAAHIQRDFGASVGHAAKAPLGTVTSGGSGKSALVTSHVAKLRGTHFAEVRAFLIKYYGVDVPADIQEPLATVTTKDRFGLVTVQGEEYQIVDIGMRMLVPRELFRAQGFPDSYIIDRDVNGKTITKTNQVKMCGNSVAPDLAEALAGANYFIGEMQKAEGMN